MMGQKMLGCEGPKLRSQLGNANLTTYSYPEAAVQLIGELGGFANRISETSTETGRGRVRESKNNGASFRKFIRMFGSTGLEPNKIFGSVLWSAAVPRSFQHCNRPIHRDSV